jgi:hypothetical protein
VGRSQQVTRSIVTPLDAASRASAAAHRLADTKQLYREAEAVWAYAKRSGDYDLQNGAAEIRLFAQRRASELLAEMAIHPGVRGQGQPRREGAKMGRSTGTTAYPAKLAEIGVMKDQASKWLQIARWMHLKVATN